MGCCTVSTRLNWSGTSAWSFSIRRKVNPFRVEEARGLNRFRGLRSACGIPMFHRFAVLRLVVVRRRFVLRIAAHCSLSTVCAVKLRPRREASSPGQFPNENGAFLRPPFCCRHGRLPAGKPRVPQDRAATLPGTETQFAASVHTYFAPVGTRRRSSSKKFSRTVSWVTGSAVPSAYRMTAKRLPSGARSKV